MLPKPRALIFDADGMIIDHDRLSSRLSSNVSPESIATFFSGPFQRCLVGQADLKEELAKTIGHWGVNTSVDELLDFWFDAHAARIDHRFHDIIQKLRAAGVRSYLATNNEKYRTDNLLHERRLNEWFDGVYSSGYIGTKKPDTAFFQHIVDDTGLDIGDFHFWDDDVENVTGATAFGFHSNLYTDFDAFERSVMRHIS